MIKKIDAINEGIKILKDSSVADYKLSSQYILAVALDIDYSDLDCIKEITKKEHKRYLKLLAKRCKGVPLNKIIGYDEFYRLVIPFSKYTLSPRQETELLADMVIKDISASKNMSRVKVLDLCAGSGCIGISIAKSCGIPVTLADISKKVLKCAKKNSQLNNANYKMDFVQSDLFENIHSKYDIIVCNPPYIKSEDIHTLEKEVKYYDPILALDGGEDGLYFYRKIIREATNYLTTDNDMGYIYFEIGIGQSEEIVNILQKDFVDIKVIKDYSGIDRFILAKKREKDA